LKISLFSIPSSFMIQWSECFIVFLLFWKSHCSPCLPASRSSDQSVSLSFHCFENPTVLHAIQSCVVLSYFPHWFTEQIVSILGAGFKLSPVYGKILCELAFDLKHSYDLRPFRLDRFENLPKSSL
jgi:hypothetical protein